MTLSESLALFERLMNSGMYRAAAMLFWETLTPIVDRLPWPGVAPHVPTDFEIEAAETIRRMWSCSVVASHRCTGNLEDVDTARAIIAICATQAAADPRGTAFVRETCGTGTLVDEQRYFSKWLTQWPVTMPRLLVTEPAGPELLKAESSSPEAVNVSVGSDARISAEVAPGVSADETENPVPEESTAIDSTTIPPAAELRADGAWRSLFRNLVERFLRLIGCR